MSNSISEPRFLGWREWSDVDALEHDCGPLQRRAIWSDGQGFDYSDGFDIRAWRKNHKVRITKDDPHSRLPPVQSASRASVLCAEQGNASNLPRKTHGTQKHREPHAAAELESCTKIEISEVCTSSFRENTVLTCRGDVAQRKTEMEEEKIERARCLRSYFQAVGRKARRRVQVSRSKMQAIVSEETAKNAQGLHAAGRKDSEIAGIGYKRNTVEEKRARRLVQVLARLCMGGTVAQKENGVDGTSGYDRRRGGIMHIASKSNLEEKCDSRKLKQKMINAVRSGIDARKRLHRKEIKLNARRDSEFNAIPAVERADVDEVVQIYEKADDSCAKIQKLTQNDALKFLAELGLRGTTQSERRSVVAAVESVFRRESQRKPAFSCKKDPGKADTTAQVESEVVDAGSEGEFGSYRLPLREFCTEIMPAARLELSGARLDGHSEVFVSALQDNEVFVSKEALEKVVSNNGFDADLVAPALVAVGGDTALVWSMGTKRKTSQVDFETDMDFEFVHMVLVFVEEHTERRKSRMERYIQRQWNISEEMFWKFRQELISLHRRFTMYDIDGSGFLSNEEVSIVLTRSGLQPFGVKQNSVVESMLRQFDKGNNNELEFGEFLVLVEKLRQLEMDLRRPKLTNQFYKHDRDLSGGLDPKELVELLVMAGITPERSDQKIALFVFEQFDYDHSGSIDLEELEQFTQRILEEIHIVRNARRMDDARKYGLQPNAAAQLQKHFDQLDVNNKGIITQSDLFKLFDSISVNTDEICSLRLAYLLKDRPEAEIDETPTKPTEKTVDFETFLGLVCQFGAASKLIEEVPPFSISLLPSEKLRDILRIFPISNTYIRNLETTELIENVSNYTGFTRNQNLRDLPMPIRNARQLLERTRSQEAKRKSK